jgi:hypothetical protein
MKTLERCLLSLAAATALMAPLGAQTVERRATFTGGGDNNIGKCTIEVYVDGAADVEIRGDRGYLRTLSGQPAQWRRFECTGPMPTNAGGIRFVGVDGRGSQELIQDPRNGRGAIVVRIQDPDSGAEGYTFDLEWRGAGFGPNRAGPPAGGVYRGASPNDAARACQDAVRVRANQQFGLRDINFRNLNAEDNRGSNDTIMGSFDARQGNSRNTYQFSCAVDLANGRVRGVDISPGRGAERANRYDGGNQATFACQRAAEQRLQRDGYGDVRFGRLNFDNRRNDRITGTATAQRGNDGRAYNFEINCSVNLSNGNIQSMQVTRR